MTEATTTTQALNPNLIFLAGVVTIGILTWAGKLIAERVAKSMMDQFERKNREAEQEREEDMILSFRGQKITADCIHELIYAVLHDEHNGGLEEAGRELEIYRRDVDANLQRKAARWTEHVR